jgi:hypothetical protein
VLNNDAAGVRAAEACSGVREGARAHGEPSTAAVSLGGHREALLAPRLCLYAPLCRNCEAVFIPKRKPEHAAVRSKATALVAPTSRATCAASPNRSSALDVAKITSSTSSGSTPAISSALEAALLPSSDIVSPGASRCRLRMPVRCAIHSSVVSTSSSRSTLVTRVGGAQEPTPTSRDLSLDLAALPLATTGLRQRDTQGHGPAFTWAARMHVGARSSGAHLLRNRCVCARASSTRSGTSTPPRRPAMKPR